MANLRLSLNYHQSIPCAICPSSVCPNKDHLIHNLDVLGDILFNFFSPLTQGQLNSYN